MVRRAAAPLSLLALGLGLGGCDLAFSIDHISVKPAACGPYASVTPIAISGVTEPRGFSISDDGTLALVNGTIGGQTRPVPLRFNDALATWEPNPNMQTGLASGMKTAQLAPAEPIPIGAQYIGAVAPAMLLTTGTPPQLSRYYLSGMVWQQDLNEPGFGASGHTPVAGNVWVVAGADPQDRVRHTVMTLVADDPAQDATQVVIAANTPPTFFLELKNRTAGLNDTGLAFTQAVMTEDRTKLVVAAKIGERSNIYAVNQTSARNFDELGAEVPGVDTADDEVEPWIDATCSKMYFRRIPADGSNAAGQIYVAE